MRIAWNFDCNIFGFIYCILDKKSQKIVVDFSSRKCNVHIGSLFDIIQNMDGNKIETEIRNIKARNARVELDKKWETSWTRRLCICVLTYIVVVIYCYMIEAGSNIFLSSLVPVIGFTLSTLSLGLVREIWEKKVLGRKK